MSNTSILQGVAIRNFKVIRSKTSFKLGTSAYFIGQNNAGKSTVLKAIRYFFNDTMFQEDGDFLNKTERMRKRSGSSRSEITVTFNIQNVNVKQLRDDLKKKYGDWVSVSKEASLSLTGQVTIVTKVKGQKDADFHVMQDENIKRLFNSISINYLHPQQGEELLAMAQQKLKRRLLDNWGRRDQRITQEMKKIEEQWEKFKEAANKYLSSSLNESTRKMWPDSEITIGLPDNIRDVLDVSQISFSSYKGAPPIDLASQGAGAQSLILYFTHYMLDSDRTLTRAREYHPVWLIEEPESFLHFDLIAKLGDEFNSEAWSVNMQLLISTHSSVLLAKSRLSGDESMWHLVRQEQEPLSKPSSKWSIPEINDIGEVLGDANFKLYFEAAIPDDQLFLEDSREETVVAFEKIGLRVSHAVGGVSDIKNMIVSLQHLQRNETSNRIVFLVDNDKGFKTVSHLAEREITTQNSFSLHTIKDAANAYLLVTPPDTASEDLFEELDDLLDEALNELVDNTMKLLPAIPTYLSKAALLFRDHPPVDRESAKKVLKTNPDFKAFFWKQVKDRGLVIAADQQRSLKTLILAK